jgi:hypothetical protein
MMAVSCGTPTPVTTRVVQMLPGPIPTLTASAPRSSSARAPPARGDIAGDDLSVGEPLARALERLQHADGVAVRGVDDEHVDARVDECLRALEVPALVPIAAPTRSRPCCPCRVRELRRLKMSLTVIRPRSRPSASTTGSFSMRSRCRIRSASSSEVPTGAVISRSLVMTSRIGLSSSSRTGGRGS